MSSKSPMSLLKYVLPVSVAVVFAAGSLSAQSASLSSPAMMPASSSAESSSAAPTLLAANSFAETALPAAPGEGSAAPAEGAAQSGGYGGHGYRDHSFWSNLVFEAGGGFNGPTSSSSNYITWGGQFTLGGGYQFNPRFSTLLEYQFIDDKLPGKLIAEAGAQGGHAHIWSFTLAPVYDFFPKSANDLYATGGYGFYRKVSSFTNPQATQYCYFYCGYGVTNVVVGHFSSNQGGWNIGGGYTHRIGGMYGDSKVKLFAEFRYLDVLSPAITTQPNGLGTTTVGKDTKLMPVTFGVRW